MLLPEFEVCATPRRTIDAAPRDGDRVAAAVAEVSDASMHQGRGGQPAVERSSMPGWGAVFDAVGNERGGAVSRRDRRGARRR
jgi:hypothetical protein